MTESLFDVSQVPFSYFGSWMAISIPRGEEKLFLRNYHSRPNNVFPLQVLVDGEIVTPEIAAKPWALLLRHGDASIEICFESASTVRMRGQGMALRLGDRHLVYSEAPNRVVINERAALRRYQLEVLKGSVERTQHVPTQPMYPVFATVSAPGNDCWELAIDEFWSTWQRPDRADFDACLAASQDAFSAFLDAMPPARPQDEQARVLASYVNWAFTVGPCGLIKRPTLLMSKNWMANVWSWDQCFNAMALAAGQPELSLDQMLTLVDHQDEFGSYPDSINDVVRHYNFSKPPVHGWAFGEMLRRMPERPAPDVMETMYVSLSRQADWWMTYRTRSSECGTRNAECGSERESEAQSSAFALPYYLHGNDSGWDNSTMFDKGVPLVAPDLAALLVLQMDVLSELASELDRGDEAACWKARADRIYEALMRELWMGDHFVSRLANSGEAVESKSLIPWLPLILGDRLPADVRECLRKGMQGHLTDWGLATERIDSDCYQKDGYWRGPIWAPATLIAVTGLDRCGFTELADEVSEKFCRMCGKSGFAENYDAVTGDSLCDPAYTWTASVFLLLAERMRERDRPTNSSLTHD